MGEIARAAHVSVGLIYTIFPSKESLIEGIVSEDSSYQIEQLIAIGAGRRTDLRTSHGLLQAIFDRKRIALMLEIAAEGARNRRVRAVIEKCQKRNTDELRGHLASMKVTGCDVAEIEKRIELVSAILTGVAVQFAFKPAPPTQQYLNLLSEIANELLAPGSPPNPGLP
jgi:AcrR family transcriptional regulator